MAEPQQDIDEQPMPDEQPEPMKSLDDDQESIRKSEMEGKVMPWFLDQLNQYNEEEQKAIKVCAIEFVNDGKISSPSVKIKEYALQPATY